MEVEKECDNKEIEVEQDCVGEELKLEVPENFEPWR